MSTTTDPRIDVAPGPGVVHTAQDIEEEIMKEWDGVEHFATREIYDPERNLANCGAKLREAPEVIEYRHNEVIPDECPLCAAIHNEICARIFPKP